MAAKPNGLVLKSSVWEDFIQSRHSKDTKTTYQACIRKYMKFYNYTDGDVSRLLDGRDSDKVYTQVFNFLKHEKNGASSVSQNTLKMYYNALKTFYDYNDITGINWIKIRNYIGEAINKTYEEPYSCEEIQQLLSYSNERLRVVILLQCSSGMRIGSIGDSKEIIKNPETGESKTIIREGVRFKDLKYLPEYKLYEITVRKNKAGKPYMTFCTPECAAAINEYKAYRERHNENITGDSPLIRERFDSRLDHTIPRAVKSKTIKDEILDLTFKAGLRTRGESKGKLGYRYTRMVTHALRKWFRTVCQSEEVDMDTLHVEMLMGHDTGLNRRYYRPEPQRLLKKYLTAVNALTINEEERQKLKIVKLEEEKERDQLRVEKILEEKEKLNQDALAVLSDQVMKLMQEMEALKKKQ